MLDRIASLQPYGWQFYIYTFTKCILYLICVLCLNPNDIIAIDMTTEKTISSTSWS
jgi:hypothetical protein